VSSANMCFPLVAQPKALVILEQINSLLPEVKEYLTSTPSITTVLRGVCMDLTRMPQLAEQPDTVLRHRFALSHNSLLHS
jgi:hypothetical protein